MLNFVTIGQTVAAIWQFFGFMMAVVCHLAFLKVRNFNSRYGSEGHYASPCRILCRSVKLLPRCGRFSIFFMMAAVSHTGFLKVKDFNCGHGSGGQDASLCQILCQLVKPLQRYKRFSIFPNGVQPPSRIF